MRIALVTPYSWTYEGGVNRHTQALAEQLLQRGDDVRVFAPWDPPDRLSRTLHRGAPARERPLPDYLTPAARRPPPAPETPAGSDHFLAACATDVRPPDYARSFGERARRLLLAENGSERPPWWAELRGCAASERVPTDPVEALALLAGRALE